MEDGEEEDEVAGDVHGVCVGVGFGVGVVVTGRAHESEADDELGVAGAVGRWAAVAGLDVLLEEEGEGTSPDEGLELLGWAGWRVGGWAGEEAATSFTTRLGDAFRLCDDIDSIDHRLNSRTLASQNLLLYNVENSTQWL